MTRMWATGNSSLSCIQHDANFDPATSSNWLKDPTAIWSDDCSSSLSVNDETFEKDLKLYPNPVSSILTVSSNLYEIERIEVFSLHGGRIITSNNKTINVSALSSGIYLIQIRGTDQRIAIKKFLVE